MAALRMILMAALAVAGCSAGGQGNGAAGSDAPVVTADRPADTPAPDPAPTAERPGLSYGGLGETIQVGALTVRPIAVTEDSRCPADVNCVWSGRLVMRAAVSGVPGEVSLSSIEPYALPGGGTLVLASVTPDNHSRQTGARAPYRFGFRRD